MGQACDISARPRDSRDHTYGDGVEDLKENDRNVVSGGLQRFGLAGTGRNNYVGPKPNKLLR